ncbi:MAG: STAS domain-containing protein [Bacteroidetes bacterium]|nr:STAS domain-containing protein [Bacteroidota bacterium]
MPDFKLIKKTNKKNKSVNIQLQGNLTINNSNNIKNELIEALDNFNELTIAIKDVDAIDISVVQLIVSLNQTCKKKNKKINLSTCFSNETTELLEHSGLNIIPENNKKEQS